MCNNANAETIKGISITELLSDGKSKYIIPIYQRDYAWGFDEVQQLIMDINSIAEKTEHYYIGTLVVYKRSEYTYEVIDGQQRLTTLFLLFSQLSNKNDYIKKITDRTLSLQFECRDESNEYLNKVFGIKNNDDFYKLKNEYDNSLIKNTEAIKTLIKNEEEFKQKLKKVVIFRVEVPPHTDLNHYFEIMNTRGEQLEHTDIIKSRLMDPIPQKQHSLFSEIWDACSDMSRYVQQGISTSNNYRKNFFGNWWNSYPSGINWEENSNDSNTNDLKVIYTIDKAIKDAKEGKFISKSNVDENNQSVDKGYNSIISFPYFLLHAFRLFAERQGNEVKWNATLDDRNLIKDYEAVFPDKPEEKDSKSFILFLLQLRFLFDKYIIKRYYSDKSKDGTWTLRSFGRKSEQRVYHQVHVSTFSGKKSDEEDSEEGEKCKMLQSCLRVSFTSPRVMHWITRTLEWLYDNEDKNSISCSELNRFLTEYIINGNEKDGSVNIRKFIESKNYDLGVATPNLVLNYLDYCIYYDKNYNLEEKVKFKFEFRNSVEHYFPQNPNPGDGLTPWGESVNQFGNLALLQRGINSKFSNLSPKLKKEYISDSKGSMSLKLRVMAEKTGDNGNWTQEICKKHGEEMLKLLNDKCTEHPKSVDN